MGLVAATGRRLERANGVLFSGNEGRQSDPTKGFLHCYLILFVCTYGDFCKAELRTARGTELRSNLHKRCISAAELA